MKRLLYPLGVSLFALVAASILLNWVSVAPQDAGPADMYLSCPFRVVQQDGGGESHAVRWDVVLTQVEGREADIRPGSWTDVATPEDGETCLLDIRQPPVPPYDGMDWRIGHNVEQVEALRGRTVEARLLVRADRGVSFSGAYFYCYDGVSATAVEVAGLPAREWQEFRLTMRVDDNAPVFEIWLRPTLHGSISNSVRIWFGGAQVEILPD